MGKKTSEASETSETSETSVLASERPREVTASRAKVRRAAVRAH